MLNKSAILSKDELSLQFNKKSLNEIVIASENSETFATKIMKNDKLKKITITLLGCGLYFKKVMAATKGIDGLGWTILGLIRQWGYWILLIACTVEIIRAGTGSDSKKILSIVMKFLLIFALMYIVPEGFNAIKNSF
ncbi:hypothetical protein [Clostridium tagluense]|uniref:hypothetical protein n=1 Tax=Clostridium tagluense TaxID=360422 RepID=UPI001CF1ED50|nr:hypothetical protein [Clostridium tagluense]MCB2297827.1 hypothetical protein [Clostridium tagluense]